MNTFKHYMVKLVAMTVVLMMVFSGMSSAGSVYAVGETTQQNVVDQNETASQTSEPTTQETNDGSSNTATSATENEKVEEKTDAQKSTGEDPPATTETKQKTGTSVNEETNKGNTDATKEETKTTTNEEKKADPIEMPAASFSASTSKLNISVTALANTFPKGTTMKAKEISASYAKSIAKEKLNDVNEAVGADITFYYNGKEVQPANNKNVTVKMTLKNAMEGKSLHVLHKKDSGKVESINANITSKRATFSAKSFSIYVIADTTKFDTYEFYDGNKKIMSTYTQKITAGETLDKPNAPEKEGYKFIGWATSANAAEADFDNFGKVITNVNGTTHKIYAVFKEVHYVFFMTSTDDKDKVAVTKEGTKGTKISADEIAKVKLGLASNQSIEGWYHDQALTNKVDSITIGDKNIHVYPKIQTGHHITFDSHGGTYYEPLFIKGGKPVEKDDMPTPKKKGYTFLHWSTSKDGEEYTYGKELTEELKLYAVYEAADTTYTVVFWKQSRTDAWDKGTKTYQVDKSETRTAKTGAIVTLRSSDRKAETGFTFNETKTQESTSTNYSTKVDADGKTTMNVYFDRRLVTFNFNYPKEYGYGYNVEKYQGLYEADFKDWDDDFIWYYNENQGSKTRVSFLDAFIPPDLTKFTTDFYQEEKGTRYVHFYKQALNGSYDDSNPDKSVGFSGNGAFSITDKYTGFTASQYKVDNNRTWTNVGAKKANGSYGNSISYRNNLYIRFSRNSYNLIFYNYDHSEKTDSVKYEGSLSGYIGYEPSHPSSLDEEYYFDGWYKDKAFTNEFNFDSTMPAHGITLYAKWKAKDVSVTVKGLDQNKTQLTESIPFRSTIDISDLPTVKDSDGNVIVDGNDEYTYTVPKGSSWVGWATKDKDDNYTLFNFNTELKKDLTLYPYVIDSNKYTVSYNLGDGKGSVSDDKLYALNSYADVKSAKDVTPPSGSMFLNWQVIKVIDGDQVSTDTYLYPGDKLKMTSNMILQANYIAVPTKVNLVYYANNKSSSNAVVHTETDGTKEFANNSQITLKTREVVAAPVVGEGVKAEFTGWNTKADGSGDSFNEGAKVGINKLGTNELYAQWKYVVTIKGKTDSKTYTGKEQSVEGLVKDTFDIEGTNITINGVTAKTSGTDVGVYTNTQFTFDGYSDDFSKTINGYKVYVETQNGQLTITPYETKIVIDLEDASKTYDGTPLTSTKHTTKGLPEGYTTQITTSGSQTDAGKTDNKITSVKVLNADGKDVTRNFTIDSSDTAALTVTPIKLTVKTGSSKKEYDGTPLTNSEITLTGKPVKGEITGYKTTGTITDLGTAANTYKLDTGDGYKAGNYLIKEELGKLEITNNISTVITVTADSDSKIYDGTALTKDTATVDGVPDGFTYSYKVEGSQTHFGTAANKVTEFSVIDSNGKDVTKYFDNITKRNGTLTVTKRPVTITSASDSKTYDGTALTNHTVTESKDGFVKGEGLDYNVTGTQTNAGSSNNAFTYTAKEGTSLDDYDITKTEGTLTVNQRKVTLTSESASKAYDGTALTSPDVTVTGDGFVDDEVSDLKATGSITEIGSTSNSLSYTKKDNFKEDNYIITEIPGTLTITKNAKTIVITAPSASKMYDGTALTKTTDGTIDNLPDGFSYEVISKGSITNVGTKDNVVDAYKIYDSNKKEVTDHFTEVQKVNGTLTVTKRHVILTSESASKPYDGTALTKPDVTVTGDGFVKGEVADLKATGSITKVGSVKNSISYTTTDQFNEGNYNIELNPGTLTITKNTSKVKFTAASDTKTYDGKALTKNTYSVAGLPEGFETTATVTGSVTHVLEGQVANTISNAKIFYNGKDVTDQFASIETEEGTLQVTVRPITLTSKSATAEYTGQALTRPAVTVDGTIIGEDITNIKATGSQTDVGSSTNTITYDATDDALTDYAFNVNEGTLTITNNNQEVTVKAASDSKKYDGTALTKDSYKTEGLPEGLTLTATVEGSATNVSDTGANKVTSVKITNAEGIDVTKYFTNIENVDGKLTITPRTVKLMSASDEKEYDGTALTNAKVTVDQDYDDFVDGEVSNLKANGSQINVGSSENKEITFDTGDGYKDENYEIEKSYGTLTVTDNTSRKITIEAPSANKTYDGKALTAKDAKVTGLPDGFTYEVKITGLITDFGTADNKVASYKIYDAKKKEVTDHFKNITTKDGTLTVNKRKVTLTSESAAKAYDGTALTRPDVKVTGDGFVEGEVSEIKATGSITEAGSVKNSISYKENKGFKESNYDITLNPGTLTITQNENEVVITLKRKETTYNGKEVTSNAFDAALPEGFEKAKVTVTTDGKITNTGTVNNNITDYKITLDGKDITKQFKTITCINSEIVVNKRNVTLTSATASKTYDGKPLTASKVTVSGDGFVDGEVSDLKAEGTITYVGKVKNSPMTFTKNEGYKDANYNITYNPGTLTVTDDVTPDTVVKKTHESKEYGLGDTINFTIKVTNIYNETKTLKVEELKGVTITSTIPDELAPGESATLTATYQVSEEDIKSQNFTNKVKVTLGNQEFTDDDDVPEPEIEDAKPHVTITKKAENDTKKYKLGEKVEYTITAKNDGNLTLTNVVVTDNLTGAKWTIKKLEPGETSKDLTTTYTVTEKDIIAGQIVNKATMTSVDDPTPDDKTDPDPGVTPGEETVDTEDKKAHITITKNADSDTKKYKLGEKVDYTITAKNDGNLTLTNIVITDDLTGEKWTIDKLEPGETSKKLTTTYTVTEKDIHKGKIVNKATMTSVDDPTPDDKTDPDPTVDPGEETVDTEDKKAHITISKDAKDETKKFKLGEKVEYTITAKNDGNLTLTNVVITDDLTGAKWTIDKLEPGQTSKKLTTTYTVTEKDIKAGKIVNKATMTSVDDPTPNDKTDPDPGVTPGEETVDTEDKKAHITITKDAKDETKKFKLGDTVDYTITAKNDGNLTLTNVVITDDLTGAKWTIDKLEPGETSKKLTTTYTVTEKDIIAGKIVNKATMTSVDDPTPDDKTDPDPTADPGEETVDTEEKDPHLTITKKALDDKKEYKLGETVHYIITAKNDGNLTLTNVEMTDYLTGEKWTIKKLEPGETSASYSASYVINEDDIKAGKVKNVVTMTNVDDPTPDDKTDPDPGVTPGEETVDTEDVKGHVTITKKANENKAYKLGEEIKYTITATNDGNVTLTNIVVTDDLTGKSWTIDKLEPGKTSKDLTTTYTVTEKDIKNAKVVNVATMTSVDDPTPNDKTDPDPGITPGKETVEVENKNAHITITKKADHGDKKYKLGEEVKYTITAKNDGNLTLTNIKVTDDLTGEKWTIDKLAPGETSKELTTTYKVTEDDIKAGKVVNKATMTSVYDPTPEDKTDPDPGVTPGEETVDTEDKNGHITITKKASDDDKKYKLGEKVDYTITAKNDGNLTLTNIVVKDDLTGESWLIDKLAPGETSKELTTTYTVTEKDIIAGKVVNKATMTDVDDPTPEDPKDPDPAVDPGEETVDTEDKKAHLTVTKKASDDDKKYKLGETVEYTITAKNDGNLTLTNVVITDDLTGDKWTIDKLAPGETSKDLTTTYTVTEKDILAGKVVNKATMTSVDDPTPEDPKDPDPTVDPGEETVDTEDKKAHITITKKASDDDKKYKLGEEVKYTITAKNDGNLTLTNVEITDDLTGDHWTIKKLEPGETSKDLTTTYTVTEKDIIAGKVVNKATMTNVDDPTPNDPDDPAPTDEPGEETVTTEDSHLSTIIEKTVTNEPADKTAYKPGEQISYLIKITNTGNQTLRNVVVEDPLTKNTWTLEILKPNETSTLTAYYTVTQQDGILGKVTNKAEVTKSDDDDPNKDPIHTSGEVTVQTVPNTETTTVPTSNATTDTTTAQEETVPTSNTGTTATEATKATVPDANTSNSPTEATTATEPTPIYNSNGTSYTTATPAYETESPKTGDDTDVTVMMLLLSLAFLILLGTGYMMKKKSHE